MARILVTQPLVDHGGDRLAASPHEVVQRTTEGPMPRAELIEAVSEFDAIVCLLSDRFDATVLEAASRLRVVGNVAVGVDNIDLAAAAHAGVAVVNTPGVDTTVLHHTRTDTGLPGWTGSLHEMARRCDVLSIHVPSSAETRHLIDAEVIGELPRGAVVINTARGPVLDEEALADALDEGRLSGAGLDVFDGEPTVNPRLLAAPGCTLLPHIGSATVSVRRAMCDLACAGVLSVLDGGSPANLVAP